MKVSCERGHLLFIGRIIIDQPVFPIYVFDILGPCTFITKVLM